MLSVTRRFFKSTKTAGFHFLCEARYGVTNAPFFGLFSGSCKPPSILGIIPASVAKSSATTSSSASSSPSAACLATSAAARNEQVEALKKELKEETSRQTTESTSSSSSSSTSPPEPTSTSEYGLTIAGSSGGRVAVTLNSRELSHAIAYCKVVITLCEHVSNSRDWLAGWAATITSNADLVDCALQAPADPGCIPDFFDQCVKERKLSERQIQLVTRCLLFDAITAVTRARGANDLVGLDLVVLEHKQQVLEQEEVEEEENQRRSLDNNNNNKKKKKQHDEKNISNNDNNKNFKSIDSIINCDFHSLQPIFSFARSQNISDADVAEMFGLAIEEAQVAEEKFSLIADGDAVPKVS